MTKRQAPDWVKLWAGRALVGEIYPSIRAVAVDYKENGKLTLRYYLDRPPREEDYESIGVVVTNILANTKSSEEIKSVNEEIVFSQEPLGSLDVLGGLVYARREYEDD